MILERGKAGDRLTAYPESGNAVPDKLFRVRDELKNRAAQRLKRAAARLLDTTQVLVDNVGGPRRPSSCPGAGTPRCNQRPRS